MGQLRGELWVLLSGVGELLHLAPQGVLRVVLSRAGDDDHAGSVLWGSERRVQRLGPVWKTHNEPGQHVGELQGFLQLVPVSGGGVVPVSWKCALGTERPRATPRLARLSSRLVGESTSQGRLALQISF